MNKALIDGGAGGNVIPRRLAEAMKARYIPIRAKLVARWSTFVSRTRMNSIETGCYRVLDERDGV